jgi:hypothetical protein
MARMPYDSLELGKLIARAWADPRVRVRLLTNPKEMLEEAGVHVGDHRIIMHEDTEVTTHIVLRRRPEPFVTLGDADLMRIGSHLMNGSSEGCEEVYPPEREQEPEREPSPEEAPKTEPEPPEPPSPETPTPGSKQGS